MLINAGTHTSIFADLHTLLDFAFSAWLLMCGNAATYDLPENIDTDQTMYDKIEAIKSLLVVWQPHGDGKTPGQRNSPAHNPLIKPQHDVYTLWFVYRLNK